MRRPLPVLLVLLCVALASACGTSGRDLREPQSGAVSPTRPTSSTTSTQLRSTALALVSSDFIEGEPIPADLACAGSSPAFNWSAAPKGTTELALVMTDRSAEGYVHWIVTGIPATTAAITKGQLPVGAAAQPNSAGKNAWLGPCPPPGAVHTYDITLFALTQPPVLTGLGPKEMVAALQQQVTSGQGVSASLSGTYGATTSGTTPGTASTGTGAPGGTASGGATASSTLS